MVEKENTVQGGNTMLWDAKWIRSSKDFGEVCPAFSVEFKCDKQVKKAVLAVTALGVYEAKVNGCRVGEFVLAPGWTTYHKRLQVQEYDVKELLAEKNELVITVGKGWYRSPFPGFTNSSYKESLKDLTAGLTAGLTVTFEDGTVQTVSTDENWKVMESAIRFAEIYDGEIYDATFEAKETYPVTIFDGPTNTLIPQQGEEIREQERVAVREIFTTPAGETVVDFGQEVTGYVEIAVNAHAGDVVRFSFAEVMDQQGNFYTENYRSAKPQSFYTCKEGWQTYKPSMTFFGFRYIRIDEFPGGAANIRPENVTAIVVHSQMERTGFLKTSDPMLNKLFENIIWGQKCNFLDVPTDCPQRDERCGWTGDAQVFAQAACLNYDAEKFFAKWLADMAADQKESGMVGHVIPNVLDGELPSAAWDDAATICPWTIYRTYGDPQILKDQYECMTRWVGYVTNHTRVQYLWIGAGAHYGDWLGLDAPEGSRKGASRDEFIASAFYAYSVSLVIKAGKVLGKDVSEYEALYEKIVEAFRETFNEYKTQTECVLAAYFRLAPEPQAAADQLAEMIRSAGTKIQTGFVGTPYILHVLSDYGYTELAYDLLLRKEYPSWLYPVTKGATTIWEHWDSIMENGDFWDPSMNSFNHYAYGSVADWVYCKAAGIDTIEEYPGFEKVRIEPRPDKRLEWLEASLKTRHGLVRSCWHQREDRWRYEIETPVEAIVVIEGKEYRVKSGTHLFFGEARVR